MTFPIPTVPFWSALLFWTASEQGIQPASNKSKSVMKNQPLSLANMGVSDYFGQE
jgi:hypothetical protein